MHENKAQQAAIQTVEGPLILISCPGSGKTTTLVRRICHMVQSGISPQHILMVTFSNAAATDMQLKYDQMTNGKGGAVTFSTIHALCYRILLSANVISREGLVTEKETLDQVFSYLKTGDQINDPWETARDIVLEFSVVSSNDIDDIRRYHASSCDDELFRRLYTSYCDWKVMEHRYDFDDMLILCRDYLLEHPKQLQAYQNKYQYIQVDEYQDTNKIQKDIIYLLAGSAQNLCVVGDDDQSIYSFRGASPQIMLSFQADFPNCKQIFMDTNYRSTETILGVASDIIEDNQVRYQKELHAHRGAEEIHNAVSYHHFNQKDDEMTYLREQIMALHKEGIPYEDIAVLVRTKKQAEAPVRMLAAYNIPYRSTEQIQTIYDGWIYQIIQTYVKLAVGQGQTKDMLYVLNRPNRFLWEKYYTQTPYDLERMLIAASYLKCDEQWKYDAAERSITKWMDLFGPGKLSAKDDAKLIFDRLEGTNGIGLDHYLEEYASRRGLEIAELMEEYELLKADAMRCKTVGNWIRYAAATRQKVANENQINDMSGVTVSTMHKAKGLEWKAVFITDLNESILPHRKSCFSDEAIEEERRLLYVAMTRAKDHLELLSSGKESRFLISLFEKRPKHDLSKRITLPAIGTKVKHPKYGEGCVQTVTPTRIEIAFAFETKKFVYPDCVTSGFITLI